MKRAIAILLAFCLGISLCACGGNSDPTEPEKSAEAQKADELILAIGEITIDSGEAIKAAQEYYDSLSEAEKAEVEHYDLLAKAPALLKEAIWENAVSLYENGSYIEALAAFRDMEQTDEGRDYIEKSGMDYLANYIYSKGTKGNSFGKYGSALEKDGYYLESDGIILFVKTNGSVYEHIEITSIVERDYGSHQFYILTLYPGSDEVFYQRMFDSPLNYSHKAYIQKASYTADTAVDFNISYISARPNFSSTREELNTAVRDSLNELLGMLGHYLKKNECGVTLYDLGLFSYGDGRPDHAPEKLEPVAPQDPMAEMTDEEKYAAGIDALTSDGNAAYKYLLSSYNYKDSAELVSNFLPIAMVDVYTGAVVLKYHYEYNDEGKLSKIIVENPQYEIGKVTFELDENLYPVVAHCDEGKYTDAYDINFTIKKDEGNVVTEIVATYTVEYKNGSIQENTDTYVIKDGFYVSELIDSYVYTVNVNGSTGVETKYKTVFKHDAEAISMNERYPGGESAIYQMGYNMARSDKDVGYMDIPFFGIYIYQYIEYYDVFEETPVK